ncbi:MAG: hypothetical protein ACO23H_11610 [Alphaproteobacteria bacterium]
MWIAVVMICASPMDVRTCDVLVRTDQGFFSQEACAAQVREDVTKMKNGMNFYARYKCYQMQGTT